MKKHFIKDLSAGEILNNENFLLKEVTKLRASNDKEYWKLVLADKSGEIGAKVWEDSMADCESIDAGNIVSISGEVKEFKNQKQIIVKSMASTDDFELSDFIQQSAKDLEKLYAIIEDNISTVSDKYLKKLLGHFFGNDEFKEYFQKAPGAEKIHHAYLGGLMEHVTEMLNLAKVIMAEYDSINKDLLITGILLHDIGKMQELSANSSISRTLKGKFIGHLSIGAIQVAQAIEEIKNFPEILKYKVLNMVLSHHGRLEFGSPVKPALLEAIVLYYLDEISAKTNVAAGIYESGLESPEIFAQRHFALDNAEIYIGKDADSPQAKLL